MDQRQLESDLSDLSIGTVRYFDQVASTHDIAARWVAQGAPDMAVVVADEQTNGRGRAGRRWYTPPGAALAISLIFYPTPQERGSVARITALGALAVCDTLKNTYHLPAQIKWPNDILVSGKKVAGVLVEAQWNGDQLQSTLLGIGINVTPASVEATLSNEVALRLPPTCIASEVGFPVDRAVLLHAVLANILVWRSRLAMPDFLQAWEAYLAYLDEWVQVLQDVPVEQLSASMKAPSPIYEGQIVGLSQDGSLQLQIESGEMITLQFGEVRLRPVKKTTSEEEAYVR
jgi:BirA family biotin operon repressor/biotin-[acetyl-CoA-carboxylase] ligase